MGNPNVSILSPDKLIKDALWDDLLEATKYARGKLLDIGCGSMPYKLIFRPKVKKYVGLDIRSSAADIKQDFLKAKIQRNSYETVLCTQVLEHTHSPLIFLRKVNTVLKRGGILILTVPFTGALHEEPHDYYRFTKYGLFYLLKETGFKIVYIKTQGNWISSIGQDMIFYLEPSFNKYLLKYPKRVMQLIIQLTIRALSQLPEYIVKSKHSHINYIVVAKKV